MARKKILIVGGGTAGWLSAIVLHKKYDVHLVESPYIPTVGVGESTTETVIDALRQAGVNIKEFMDYCNGTPKYGVLFDNWSEQSYFHAFGENFLEHQFGAEDCIDFLTKCYKTGRDITSLIPYTLMAKKGIPYDFSSDEEFFNDVAIQWQNGKVPEYFKKFLHGKIKHSYDTIKGIYSDEFGITSVHGQENNYNAHYYIDCTGSARLLSKELGIKWESWSNETPLDSALTYSAEYKPNIFYTTATAWDCGWEWSIPLQDKMQHGYVYSSKHATKEQALEEIKRRRGDVKITNELRFESGVLNKVADKNMISIGLSSHFIEPLEATNIEMGVIMAKEFDNAIEENDVGFTKLNKRLLSYIDEIKNFVILHYSIPDKPGKFWEDIYKQYSESDIVDRKQIYPWHIFNWYSVAQGINFDKELYENIDVEVEYFTSEFEKERKVAELERMESETRGLS